MKLRLTIAAALCALAAGCGGSDDEPESTPAPAAGDAQQLFVSNCGSCHTLAAAGTSGRVGPDLDQVELGVEAINAQVTNGGGAMPPFKGKLTPEQIQEISQYVADNAGG